jgi:hypothetical protein
MAIGNDNQIGTYLHCAMCIDDMRAQKIDMSPAEFQKLEVGWTPKGLQVWCRRHDVNILHVDFEGHKHPANVTRKLPGDRANAALVNKGTKLD